MIWKLFFLLLFCLARNLQPRSVLPVATRTEGWSTCGFVVISDVNVCLESYLSYLVSILCYLPLVSCTAVKMSETEIVNHASILHTFLAPTKLLELPLTPLFCFSLWGTYNLHAYCVYFKFNVPLLTLPPQKFERPSCCYYWSQNINLSMQASVHCTDLNASHAADLGATYDREHI